MKTFYPLAQVLLILALTLQSSTIQSQDYNVIADRICKYTNQEQSYKNDIINLINERAQEANGDLAALEIHHHLLQRALYKNCSVFEKFNWSLQENSFILDIQNLMSVDERKIMQQHLQKINSQIKMDIYVVTIDDFVDQNNLESFSNVFIQQNDNKRDNGNLVIVYNKVSKNIRISANYKASAIIDNQKIQTIINSILIPAFKERHYYNGYKTALSEIQRLSTL